MKLVTNNKKLAENKVIILYILNKVNKPLNNTALLKLVLSLTDMNYFYFQQFLVDLVNSKYIVQVEKDEICYKLTDTGKEVLELTQNVIPGILKLKIDNSFKQSLSKINDEISIIADFIPESETEYTVVCKIIENNKKLFEIQVFTGSREQAKKIVDNWNKNSSKIYGEIFKLLTE
ncbi:MAG: DUF4364 family protein [Oscillospiraceae bacterium]|nr:DUF4364 family protein [Oscillospiraceae bacterium]